jgi:hypothetical protein
VRAVRVGRRGGDGEDGRKGTASHGS